MTRKKILIVVYSHIDTDPRVKKQLAALQEDYDITTAGSSPLKSEEIIFYPIRFALPFSLLRKLKRLFLFLFRRYNAYYWDESRLKFIDSIQNEKFDLIIANDIDTVPLAFEIAKKNDCKVYFDAHEYHPKEFEDSFKWRIMHQGLAIYLCKKYIPKVDFFTTVSSAIAEEYEKNFGKKPTVVTNATDFKDLSPTTVDEKSIRLIHHGAAIPSRKIENMIEVMKSVDKRFSLDLMLKGDQNYIERLRDLSKDMANVNLIPPVEQEKISSHINQYDLGIYILKPTNFNNRNALPNKLFDFIQARLGIVISPNPEMKSLIEKHAIGSVAEDYSTDSMVKLINSITAKDIENYKNASHLIAREVSSDKNLEKINQQVRQLLS